MSATPHNGKEADFQLFMGLLDADRFEGRFREGVHKADVTDMMRRMTKEELYRFDGTPLFPERRAYTASYALSPVEADLYQAVTTYVREEMNRADRSGDDKRRSNVGFALQILQRRLASSPAAIHRSLERRRKKLEERLREEKLMRQTGSAQRLRRPRLFCAMVFSRKYPGLKSCQETSFGSAPAIWCPPMRVCSKPRISSSISRP